jgi:deoxyribonucleoside regulator
MIDDFLLYEVARDYHIEQKLQREIAERLGVSRVQVGKYLKMAQERGLVQIQVIPPRRSPGNGGRVEEFFRSEFGIKHIVTTPPSVRPDRVSIMLAAYAREFIESMLPDEPLNIGISWGTTMYQLAQAPSSMLRKRWRIVPVSGGSSRIADKHFNINHIVHTFAESYQAQSNPVYLPFSAEESALEAIRNSEDYARTMRLWDNLDVFISSVGYDLARSPLFRDGVINGARLDELENRHVVGDVASHYYDIEGIEHPAGFSQSTINISLDQIRAAGKRIIVAGGFYKVESILGLMRLGIADVLITDIKTAETVMDYVLQH